MDRWVAKLRDGVAKYRQNGDQRDKWVAKKRDGRLKREMGG